MNEFPEGEDLLEDEDVDALAQSIVEAAETPEGMAPLVPREAPVGPRYQSRPLPDGDVEEESEPEPEPEATIEGFPIQVRDDVEGLMWLGYLEDTFTFGHHTFTIRTLRGEEELLAGLVTKKYNDIIGRDKAWAWAQVALALVAVDNDPNFCPMMGPDKEVYAEARFRYCTGRWFWPVCAYVLTRYAELLARQNEALEALQDLS